MRATELFPVESKPSFDYSQVERLVDQGALFFISTSAGKDSQCMEILLNQVIPHDQIVLVHADLGRFEWDGVIDHILKYTPHELLIAQAIWKDGSKKDFLNMVERRHQKLQAAGRDVAPFPSSDKRFCTSDLKRDPVHKVIRRVMKERGASIGVNCTGMRALESKHRAKMKIFELCNRLCISTRTVYEWRPILRFTREEVFQTIADAGQQPHPAYELNERLSCKFCIFGCDGDLRHAATKSPEVCQELIEIEERTGYTMFNGKSLRERVGLIATDA